MCLLPLFLPHVITRLEYGQSSFHARGDISILERFYFLPEFERFSDPVENYIAVKTHDNRNL